MYGKIFESMYDGTLSADWKAMVTFQQFIVLADSEGVVDYTPPALSRRTGIPLDIIEHGIEKLEQPDKYSRSSESDGRRIVRLDEHRPWGWLIVNYEHYRDIARHSDKREKSRERKRKQRERERQAVDSKDVSHNVTPCHASVTPLSVSVSVSKSISEDLIKEGINPEAWFDYVQHRKEIKKKITPLSETKQKNILRRFDFESQQKIVDTTVANGWIGLFPERIKERGKKLTYAEQLAEDLKNAQSS